MLPNDAIKIVGCSALGAPGVYTPWNPRAADAELSPLAVPRPQVGLEHLSSQVARQRVHELETFR